MKNKDEKWIIDYNFKKDGIYKFKLIFRNKITDLSMFFLYCIHLYTIDLSNLDTSYVTSMRSTFNGCIQLKEIKGLNNLNTSNVRNMRCLFQECKELEYLDLSNFDTSNTIDLSYMFQKCYKLKEIKGINKFNTKNVCYMQKYVFTM